MPSTLHVLASCPPCLPFFLLQERLEVEEATIRDDFDEMLQLSSGDTASSDTYSSEMEAVALNR